MLHVLRLEQRRLELVCWLKRMQAGIQAAERVETYISKIYSAVLAYCCVCDQRKPHLGQLQHDLVLCQAWPLIKPAFVLLW